MATTLFIEPGGDLYLDPLGRLVLEEDEVVAACIKLRNRFRFFLGEWFLDVRQGVPYFQFVFVKNPNLPLIRRLFMRIIRSVPQITAVSRVDLYPSPEDRGLVVYFEARAIDGRLIQGGLGTPFIIEGKEILG